MPAIQNISIAAYGEQVSGIKIAVGASVSWTFRCQDPTTRAPLDLTGSNTLQLTLSALDMQGHPIRPALITRQLTIATPATTGIGTTAWVTRDTVPATGPPFKAGRYGLDLWWTDPAGNRLQQMAFGFIDLTPTAGLPGDSITPLPAQLPLAKGDPGVPIVAYANLAAFPPFAANVGRFAYALDTNLLYVSENGAWRVADGASASLPTLAGADGAVLRETEPGGLVGFARLTADDIDPPFAVTGFAPGFATTKELGDTIVNPAFTASYNATLSALTLNDGAGALPISLAHTTAFAYDGGASGLPARTYSRSTVNGSYTWTLNATKTAGPTRSASLSAVWYARAYYQEVVPPGAFDQTFITALANTRLQGSVNGAYAFDSGGGTKKLYIALAEAWGAPPSFHDAVTGDIFPFSKVASAVAVTNSFAAVVPGGYGIYASDNFTAVAFTVAVP